MTTPNTFKQSNVFAAYSPVFAAQAAIGEALDPVVLTARLPLARTARPLPTRRVTRDETRDCTGRFLVGRRLTSRLALWSLTFPDVSARFAAGLYAMAYGAAGAVTGGSAPYTSPITRLASDQLPATSFVVGAEDSDEPAELYRDMVLNSLELRGEVRQKLSLTAGFIGATEVEILEDYEVPACGSTPVALYPQDCLLTLGGTDYTDNLRSLAHTYSNNVYSNDDPFVWDSVDPARLERGLEVSQFQFGVYGTKAHPLYAQAKAENVLALSLRLGSANEGTTIASPGAQLTLGDTPIGYAGEASRSVVNLIADPFSVGGAIPDGVTYVGSQNGRFLVVPA
ncbi:MAG: phage tail tube protein [Pyrinomonadaceae bacterium]